MTTITALSIALSSPAPTSETKLQSHSSRSTITTQYRLASNSLVARASDKTPRRDSHAKGDLSRSARSSRSTFTLSVVQAHSLYSLPRQAVTLHRIF
ncbi:hypothetical protein AVEN_163581-1 [Araneus ventricosus]|uniref:Uncharacterized protein n=1 Tax=Araneus ventricosus TaxID=182803 RepID=A0A4Y2LSY1_ARAVE|nr:hypothetical protein AVEN_95954-1 [Araneus ventricosus]GBN16477.1 hypothetical protein AVEN_238998-1 [Araneus ventricosus]GBN16524.1 hypothetical protein AVEN_21317-1 [Araneus ventricosus]GBN16558.1 hypothetical protein AVEN_163581-1 [Araneus ventricosus]